MNEKYIVMNGSTLFRVKTHDNVGWGWGGGKETVKDIVPSPDQHGSGLRTEAKKNETPLFCVKQVTNRKIPSDLVTPLNHKTHS